MESIHSILLVAQVLLSISLIGLILVQHGKGADAGAAFGSGASATVFGARGSGNFLSRVTTILAILFFVVCLSLAYFSTNRTVTLDSVIDMAPGLQLDSTSEQGGVDLPPAEGQSQRSKPSDLPPVE